MGSAGEDSQKVVELGSKAKEWGQAFRYLHSVNQEFSTPMMLICLKEFIHVQEAFLSPPCLPKFFLISPPVTILRPNFFTTGPDY